MKILKGEFAASLMLNGKSASIGVLPDQGETPEIDFGAVFESQYPIKSEPYSATIYYQESEPTVSWSFTFREDLEFSVTGDGVSVGSSFVFSGVDLLGYTLRIDIYRTDGVTDVFVETVGQDNIYVISEDDIGFDLFAKQRLVGKFATGEDPREFTFAQEVLTNIPSVSFVGTLGQYSGGGIGRWTLVGNWSDESFASDQFIYSSRSGGSPPSPYVAPCFTPGNGAGASAWHTANPGARLRVAIGGSGTNKTFVGTVPIVIGTDTYAGLGSPSVPGATDAEIGDSGSWNWRPGDTIEIGVFL